MSIVLTSSAKRSGNGLHLNFTSGFFVTLKESIITVPSSSSLSSVFSHSWMQEHHCKVHAHVLPLIAESGLK